MLSSGASGVLNEELAFVGGTHGQLRRAIEAARALREVWGEDIRHSPSVDYRRLPGANLELELLQRGLEWLRQQGEGKPEGWR